MASIITDAFTQDHHRCDHLLAAAETSLARGDDWTLIERSARALIDAMEEHFSIEEQTLFPQLADVFLVAANPIEVMCAEHAQMRLLLEELGAAVAARGRDACSGILETLHFAVQQHNYKEEGVLYPMADGALPERAGDIVRLLPAS